MLRHAIDGFLSKIVSRKLLVWGTATDLLAFAKLSSSDWVAISLVYIGSQGAVDLAKAWKHGS